MASTSTTPTTLSDTTVTPEFTPVQSPTPVITDEHSQAVSETFAALSRAAMACLPLLAGARKAQEGYKGLHKNKADAEAAKEALLAKLGPLKEAFAKTGEEHKKLKELFHSTNVVIKEAKELIEETEESSKRLPLIKDSHASVLEEGQFVVLSSQGLVVSRTPPAGLKTYSHAGLQKVQKASDYVSVAQFALAGKIPQLVEEAAMKFFERMKEDYFLDYEKCKKAGLYGAAWKKTVDTILSNMDAATKVELKKFTKEQIDNYAPSNAVYTGAFVATNKLSKRTIVMAVKGNINQMRLDMLVKECLVVVGANSPNDVSFAQIGKGLGQLKFPEKKKLQRGPIRPKNLENQIHGRKCSFSEAASKEEKHHLRALFHMSKEAIVRFLDEDLRNLFPVQTKVCLEEILEKLKELFTDEIRQKKTSAELLEYLFQLREGENSVKYIARCFFTKANGSAIESQQVCMMVMYLAYGDFKVGDSLMLDAKKSPFNGQVKPVGQTSMEKAIEDFKKCYGSQWSRVTVCAMVLYQIRWRLAKNKNVNKLQPIFANALAGSDENGVFVTDKAAKRPRASQAAKKYDAEFGVTHVVPVYQLPPHARKERMNVGDTELSDSDSGNESANGSDADASQTSEKKDKRVKNKKKRKRGKSKDKKKKAKKGKTQKAKNNEQLEPESNEQPEDNEQPETSNEEALKGILLNKYAIVVKENIKLALKGLKFKQLQDVAQSFNKNKAKEDRIKLYRASYENLPERIIAAYSKK